MLQAWYVKVGRERCWLSLLPTMMVGNSEYLVSQSVFQGAYVWANHTSWCQTATVMKIGK